MSDTLLTEIGSILGSEEILRLIKDKKMISCFGQSIEKQIQPEGFDLTVQCINEFVSRGDLLIDSEKKTVSRVKEHWCKKDIYYLERGEYQIIFNEEVRLPKNIHMFTVQRSSCPRCATIMHVGSWDAGYKGRGAMTLFVGKQGIAIQKNVAIVQAHFFRVLGKNFGYNGTYQNEKLEKEESKSEVNE